KEEDLHRLAFAVGTVGDQTTVVLRARPSKLGPPVVDGLRAEAYRPFAKLPNLYLPAGTTLHPPLRRDKVRELFADDPARVVWLAPAGGRGTFAPQSLPDTAFRPLGDWVDYVLDHDRAALQEWVQSAQFDFEGFVCSEDDKPKPKKPPARDRG